MSVRVNERSHGKLQVLNEARKMLEYTINTCKSDKVFPKSQRWIMANRIVNEALDCCSNIQKANTMRVDTQSSLRLEYQMQAKANLDTIYFLIDIAYTTFGIESHKIEYWAELIENTQAKLNAWIKFYNRKVLENYNERSNSQKET